MELELHSRASCLCDKETTTKQAHYVAAAKSAHKRKLGVPSNSGFSALKFNQKCQIFQFHQIDGKTSRIDF